MSGRQQFANTRRRYERDIREFVESTPDLKAAVEAEDDDAVETIVNEQFYHRPTMYYSPDKLILSYGVPASREELAKNEDELTPGRYREQHAEIVDHDIPDEIISDVLKTEEQIIEKLHGLKMQLASK